MIGLLGSVWLAVAGYGLIVAVTGIGSAVEQFAEEIGPVAITVTVVNEAAQEVLAYRQEHGDWPDQDLGQEIADQHVDGYGTPLQYTRVGEMVLIISAGKDREFATVDDVSLDPQQAVAPQ